MMEEKLDERIKENDSEAEHWAILCLGLFLGFLLGWALFDHFPLIDDALETHAFMDVVAFITAFVSGLLFIIGVFSVIIKLAKYEALVEVRKAGKEEEEKEEKDD
jgi:hypothetical protein